MSDREPPSMLRWSLLLAAVLPVAGCLQFQKGPTTQFGTRDFVEVGGQRHGQEKIYVEDGGQGEVVLLIHGFGASHTSWDAMRPELERHYRVLALDLPGHGFSDKYDGDYSMPSLARKVLAVLDAKGAARVHVVAHSFGTAVALTLARLHPGRVRSLTLAAPFAYEEQVPPFLTWCRAPGLGEFLFATQWTERVDDRLAFAVYDPEKLATPEVADKVKEVYERPGVLAAGLAIVRGMRFQELEQSYRSMKTPVLIVSGREDRVTRLPAARRLSADLPNSRHLVIPLCGHMSILEHPTKVLLELFKFLREVEYAEAVEEVKGQRGPAPSRIPAPGDAAAPEAGVPGPGEEPDSAQPREPGAAGREARP